MAPISPGKPFRVARKTGKPTQTTKQHRFEPFSKRIARLKVDPIHRVDRAHQFDEDAKLSQSHFRARFDHWEDLNLSENYRSFARTARPLSESLPQILHHADTIVESLIRHIEKKDANSLEPLLNLVESLAQDLGQLFEKYFSRTVTRVLEVAATHTAPDVIEWCFKCLAWTFKFLARLLVPDLGPLLQIVVPYLGQTKQKPYITRFAAESLAFLLRKAAISYPSKPQYLRTAVSYLLQDLHLSSQERDVTGYKLGIMTLLSEACVGVEGGLHSCAPNLISCMLSCLLSPPVDHELGLQVFAGFITNLIHQTDAAGFKPALQCLDDLVGRTSDDPSPHNIRASVRYLHLVMGVRKGSRILDWRTPLENLLQVTDCAASIICESPALLQEHLTTIAMAMQYAPLDKLLPVISRVVMFLNGLPTPGHFYAFCSVMAGIGTERFQSLLLPSFQQLVVTHAEKDEPALFLTLRTLRATGAISPRPGQNGYVACSSDFESHVLQQCRKWSAGAGEVSDYLIDAYLQLSADIHFPKVQSHATELQGLLLQRLRAALSNASGSAGIKDQLMIGRGFDTYLKLAHEDGDVDRSLWMFIVHLDAEYFRFPAFLEALATYAELTGPSTTDQGLEWTGLNRALVQNLLTPSRTTKILSLRLLDKTCHSENEWRREQIKSAMHVLETPYTLTNEREIKMLLRGLPKTQRRGDDHGPLRHLLPALCLGLLSEYHAASRDELCGALGEMCLDADDEVYVVDVATKWLQQLPPKRVAATTEAQAPEEPPSFVFQCSNVLNVDATASQTFQKCEKSRPKLQDEFDLHRASLVHDVPQNSRHLALQLFLHMPHVAEKRSRFLIPPFLAGHAVRQLTSPETEFSSISSHTLSPELNDETWSFADRKVFLQLLGKFTNPAVLYRSHDVHEKLLELLCNGSSDIQRLSLNALYTWKNPSIKPYEEQLLRLLEEKVDTAELDALLHADPMHSSIDPRHRADLLPLLLRVLYGQMISHSKAKGPQESRRRSVLRKVFNLSHAEVVQFLAIAVGPLSAASSVKDSTDPVQLLSYDILPATQQYGFLRTMHSMLETLRTQMAPYGVYVVQPIVYCTARACHKLNNASVEGTSIADGLSLTRNVRKIGLDCLVMMFERCEDVEWTPYLPLIFDEVISPRLANLAIETAQGISGLLRLFSVWSQSAKTVRFLQSYDGRVLDSVYECLAVRSAKDEVKKFVIAEIATHVATLASTPDSHEQAIDVLTAHLKGLIMNISILLDGAPKIDVVDAVVSILPTLAPFTKSAANATVLLSALVNVLGQHHKMSPRSKGGLLKAIQSLLDVHLATTDDRELLSRIFDFTSSSFNYFKDSANRSTLTRILWTFANTEHALLPVAEICHDLNVHHVDESHQENGWLVAHAERDHAQHANGVGDAGPVSDQPGSVHPVRSARLAEHRYDAQLRGFHAINKLNVEATTSQQWRPILYNLLYYARQDDDFAIRSNAVHGLRSFVQHVCHSQRVDLEQLIRTVLLPALVQGVKEDSEPVRADFVSLLGLVVQMLRDAPELADMKVLLVGNDEEASFFANVLHIQQHRRLRAINRLVSAADDGQLQSSNVSSFFLPLLEKFVFEAEEHENAQILRGQSIVAIGALLQGVPWNQFKAVFRRYRGLLDSKTLREKDVIKLLGVAADALSRASHESGDDASQLARSLPASDAVADELKAHYIPKLTEFIKHKDEAQASLRLPAAVVAVRLMDILPTADQAQLVPPVLIDICNVLRSRSQEIRDEARNTLIEISTLLGPSYVSFVIKELRTALTRGFHIQVLTYTMHKLLVTITPHIRPGALDYCVTDLMAIFMDDIFGRNGLDTDRDEHVSSMKEVKGNKRNNKSFGCIELLARTISITKVSKLLHPVTALLVGSLGSKQLQHVDEVLRRIGLGLSQNAAAGSREVLVLCYEIIQDLYKDSTAWGARPATTDESNRGRFLVQLAGANKTRTGTTASSLYKIHRFGLDLVRSSLQKHPALLSVENMQGFMPIIGDALIGIQDDVKTSAMRLLAVITKLALPELDQNASLYVMEAVKSIEASTNTNAEGPQAALKLVAAVVRDRPGTEIRQSDIAYILHKIIPDLEEPDRQGVTFNFVKAVMAREIKRQNFELADVYELADKARTMMVTNHDPGARDAARGVYVHFLLEYPQATKRWEKQRRFLVENLEYQHPAGRQSVMEAVNVLLTKTPTDRAQEIVSWFFLPVVLRIGNDESTVCRQMAATLLAQLFQKADPTEMEKMLASMRHWIAQTGGEALRKVGFQAYQTYFESCAINTKEAGIVKSSIEEVVMSTVDEADEAMRDVQLHALQLLSQLVMVLPSDFTTQKQTTLWSAVISLLSHPDTDLRTNAASLINHWFGEIRFTSSEASRCKLPLVTRHGLQLDSETMTQVMRSCFRILRHGEGPSANLSHAVARILAFLGRCFDLHSIVVETKNRRYRKADPEEDEEDDEDDEDDEDNEDDGNAASSDSNVEDGAPTRTFPAIQYLLHQLAHILRQEPSPLTSSALQPKHAAISLLITLVPDLSPSSLHPALAALLIPLVHLTSANLTTPTSADPTFAESSTSLITAAHTLLETLQASVGDSAYVAAMTEVNKIMRDRREERRRKRRIDVVTQPERAGREKIRKNEKKKGRRKEIVNIHGHRRRGLG